MNSINVDNVMIRLNIIKKKIQSRTISLIDMLLQKLDVIIVNIFRNHRKIVNNVQLNFRNISVKYVMYLIMKVNQESFSIAISVMFAD